MKNKEIIIHFKNGEKRYEKIDNEDDITTILTNQCENIVKCKILCLNFTVYNFDDISYVEFKEVNNGK